MHACMHACMYVYLCILSVYGTQQFGGSYITEILRQPWATAPSDAQQPDAWRFISCGQSTINDVVLNQPVLELISSLDVWVCGLNLICWVLHQRLIAHRLNLRLASAGEATNQYLCTSDSQGLASNWIASRYTRIPVCILSVKQISWTRVTLESWAPTWKSNKHCMECQPYTTTTFADPGAALDTAQWHSLYGWGI